MMQDTHLTHSENFDQDDKNKTLILSILIPFYKDDPTELLLSLLNQLPKDDRVEILIYDDGSNDIGIEKSLYQIISRQSGRVCLISCENNKGRSHARNTLLEAARAEWVLFLDSDMRPVEDNFIHRYYAHINQNQSDIIFGGFTVPTDDIPHQQKLHQALSQTSDCLPLADRIAKGPQYVATSNLCVRKHILDTEKFDPEFTGWGWEDSEWAARVAKVYRLTHIDNPALHLGLESPRTLLERFKTSGHNYERFTQKHPDLAPSLKLYRLSQKLKSTPGQSLMRPILKLLVILGFVPMRLRLVALKLWRASWYADALS